MKNMKRSIALLVAIALLIGCAAGGTMAWLTMQTGTITNTFTVGDINIELTESGTDPSGNKTYNFVPGDTIEKDPTVTVTAGSEDCYLFVKIVQTNNSVTATVNGTDKTVNPILTWTIADGWTAYGNVADAPQNGTYYYYKSVSKNDAGTPYAVLKDNSVQVSDEVTKEMVTYLTSSKPTLTFAAAAVQKENIADVTAAWNALPAEFK